MTLRIANAPCSWGVLEFESTALAPNPDQVLDEIAATGYVGTELGDWAFLSSDPAQLRDDLAARSLALVAAFVPVALSEASAHEEGEAVAVRTARLLADVGGGESLIVLSDATAAVPNRLARAGRIEPGDSLGPAEWDRVAEGSNRIARAVRDATGLRLVFHHHCAAYVETPWEVDALMERTDPALVGLCVDTGHATYGGGDPVSILSKHAGRVWHVHFKDCSEEIAARARAERWDYLTAIKHGLFCELGQGAVDFPAMLLALQKMRYDGWIVVEQDVLPSLGTPAESAARNRRFLTSLGVCPPSDPHLTPV
jgi:inosose dehydratase